MPEVLVVRDEPAPNLLVLGWIDEDRRAGSAPGEGDSAVNSPLCIVPVPHGSTRIGARRGAAGCPTSRVRRGQSSTTQRLLPLAHIARGCCRRWRCRTGEARRPARRFGAADEPPRLHGDLWAGNRVVDRSGASWLIDPAAHGGHREFDLAMMRLFGGFGDECYAAYDEDHPLADGWRERVALHQIAPLVVHAVKFGGGYVAAATQAIRRTPNDPTVYGRMGERIYDRTTLPRKTPNGGHDVGGRVGRARRCSTPAVR